MTSIARGANSVENVMDDTDGSENVKLSAPGKLRYLESQTQFRHYKNKWVLVYEESEKSF